MVILVTDRLALGHYISVGAQRAEESWRPEEPQATVPAPMLFADVYDQHFPFVWRMVQRLGVSPSACDDAVQDVFVVVHRRLSSFEGRSSLRSWLYGITRRVVRDHRRRAQRKDSGKVSSEGLVAHELSPEEKTQRSEARATLYRILAGLSDSHREVFVLAELEQMTAPEIAQATGVNLNTVYSRLRASRKEFNAAVERHTRQSKGACNE